MPDAETRWGRLRQAVSDDDPFTNFRLVVDLARLQQLDTKAVFLSTEGRDVAGLLATSRKVGPFLDCVPPRLVPTTPILIAPDADPTTGATACLLGEIVLGHSHRVTMISRKLPLAPTANHTWHTHSLETYVVDLQELGEDVTEKWSASARRTFRKSDDRLTVTEDASATSASIELCASAYARSGKNFGIETEGLRKIVAHPPPGICTIVLSAKDESGQLKGGLVILTGGETAYYWIPGSVPGPAMTVLIGKALDRLRAQGLRRFDFLGANVPSIAEFKRRFGPRLEPYVQFRASRSRTLDGLIAARESLRRILGG